ncbi:hypothetical protein ASG43_03320 [Aureimonas sp. Leaf454]|uniref:hypothetical protein n=1 Tax=Aureimonas sp. Leaf454 TaxID=1736381 RepID=UPI000701C008|nr:hypothetical protein [Aureimonas sp. Leaf454]KQT54630.1 hypothetical protein ASG43_03320 [Aureimonas sp. Leaf454]
MAIRSSLEIAPGSVVEVYRQPDGDTSPVTAVLTNLSTNLAKANAVELLLLSSSDAPLASTTLTAQGSGYTSVPAARVTSKVKVAPELQVRMELNGLTIGNAGLNYRVNDVLTLGCGASTKPTLTVTAVDINGRVLSLGITTRGFLTTLAREQVGLKTTGGKGRDLILSATYRVASFVLLTPGSGYSELPIVDIDGPAAGTISLTPNIQPRHRLVRQELAVDEFIVVKDLPLTPGDTLVVKASASVAVKVIE